MFLFLFKRLVMIVESLAPLVVALGRPARLTLASASVASSAKSNRNHEELWINADERLTSPGDPRKGRVPDGHEPGEGQAWMRVSS
jgi:hypothetical protein